MAPPHKVAPHPWEPLGPSLTRAEDLLHPVQQQTPGLGLCQGQPSLSRRDSSEPGSGIWGTVCVGG